MLTLLYLIVTSLPEEIAAALRKVHDDLSMALLPRVISIAELDLTQKDLNTYSGLVSGWYSLLCLNKWLETSRESTTPLLGQKLMSKLMSSRAAGSILPCGELDGAGVVTFAAILKELELRPASEHGIQLDLVAAVYISLSGTLSPTSAYLPVSCSFSIPTSLGLGYKQMDAHLAKECRKLPLEDYTHLLTLVSESLADLTHMPPDRLLQMVHLAALLLHEHPSRESLQVEDIHILTILSIDSLVHVQKFATSCINTFTEYPTFVDGPVELRLQVLDMIAQHCTDQVCVTCLSKYAFTLC